MICGIYLAGRDIGIGEVAFQPVPFRVSFKFVVIDGHLDVSFHFQELVITAPVHVLLCQGAAPVGLLQTAHPLFPVVGILAGAVIGISHQQPPSVAFVILDHPVINLRLTKYPFLYHPALIPDSRADNIFVAVRFQVGYVVAVHQSGVRHDNEVLQPVFPDKFRHYRQHSVPLVLVPLVYAVGQRITAEADKQPEYDLRILVTPFLGKACPPQPVLIVRLEIKGCNIIEQDPDVPVKYLPCMQHAYVLHDLMLAVAELVQIAVYLRQAYILVKMVLQIFCCRRLACRVGQPRLYQLPEYRALYPVEPDIVEYTVKNQVSSVYRDVCDARKHMFRT